MLEQTRPTGHGRAKGLVFNRESGQRIEAKTFAPPAAVSDFVESLWISRWNFDPQSPHLMQMLADPCVALAFELKKSRVVGVSTGLWRRQLTGRGSIRAVKLKAGAARALVDLPLSTLTDRIVPIGEVFSGIPRTLESQVLEPLNDFEALSHIVAWLERSAQSPLEPNVTLTIRLMEYLAAHPQILSVRMLTQVSGISLRPLQRLFREYVGASPKWVIRRLRLQEAALRIESRSASLTDIAAELGYADQAHLSRDFRAATGRTPSDLLRDK